VRASVNKARQTVSADLDPTLSETEPMPSLPIRLAVAKIAGMLAATMARTPMSIACGAM